MQEIFKIRNLIFHKVIHQIYLLIDYINFHENTSYEALF